MLLIACLLVLARRIGDIHPLITLAGVVLSVRIFGILGLVLGPLLLSYFIVLMKVFERENQWKISNQGVGMKDEGSYCP